MVEQKIMNYVRKAAKKGFSLDDVSKLLKKYGYKERDIDEALWVVKRELEKKEIKKPEIPSMPRHIKPKAKPIHEVEKKTEEKIQQKFFPKKEKKKHFIWVIIEIIGGILLFALVGVLMYLFLWPALLNVR